jgi:hypothetical protein
MGITDLGSIVKNSFVILFSDSLIFVVAVIYTAIIDVVSFFVSPSTAIQFTVFYILPISFYAVLSILLATYVEGVIILRVYKGRKARFVDISKLVINRYPALLATNILASIIVFLGTIAFVIPGVYLFVKLFLAPVAVLIDGDNPIDALRKSWALTNKKWWDIFAIVLVMGLILGLISFIPYVSAFIASAFIITMFYVFRAAKRK